MKGTSTLETSSQQRTELTRAQRDILKALQIDAPPRVYQLKLPAEA
jgi:hypothetical protein